MIILVKMKGMLHYENKIYLIHIWHHNKTMNFLIAFLKALGCTMICVVLSFLIFPFLGSQDFWILVTLIIASDFVTFVLLFTLFNRSKIDKN